MTTLANHSADDATDTLVDVPAADKPGGPGGIPAGDAPRRGRKGRGRAAKDDAGRGKGAKGRGRAGKGRTPHSPVPSVNLLSPATFEAIATRRLRKRFVAAGCALMLLVGTGWAVQHLRVVQARQVLVVEQGETSRLTAQTQRLAPVRSYVGAVQQQKKTVQDTMGTEIYFSRVLDGLSDATPTGAQLDSIAVTLAPPPVVAPAPTTTSDGSTGSTGTDGSSSTDSGSTSSSTSGSTDGAASGSADATTPAPAPAPTVVESPCPGPDPFHTRVVVGCVTLNGSADSRATVGRLVVALGKAGLFVEPFISTTTTADSEKVMFTGSVGLSPKVYSHRYTRIDALLQKRAR